MNTTSEFTKRIEERKIIKTETRIAMILGLCLLFLTIITGAIAYSMKIEPAMTRDDSLENIYWMATRGAVLLLLAILVVKRTAYYSPKLIKEDFTLTQVLKIWRRIDIILLAVSVVLPICGLVMTFLGMPFFYRTFHFFLGSGLLILFLMPMGIKVRSRLVILRKHFPDL